MPRRVFKHINRRREHLTDRWFMRPFKLLLQNSQYWSLHRRSVSRAFALGLFVSFTPLPIHMALSAALAILFRLNIPAAIAGSWLTNPFTAVPLFYMAYRVGCYLLRMEVGRFQFELSLDWLTTGLLPVWKPLLLGCFVMGLVSAIIGYAVIAGIWHLSLVLKYHKRKGAGPARNSANLQNKGITTNRRD
jgi:uncharacterized protein (DUF2062 family)